MRWVGFTVFFPEIGKLQDPVNVSFRRGFTLGQIQFPFWLKGE